LRLWRVDDSTIVTIPSIGTGGPSPVLFPLVPWTIFGATLLTLSALTRPAICLGQEAPAAPRLSAQAEQALQEELLFLHEESIVTANAQMQSLSQAPSNVYVITAEDIRHSGATDIPTLLRRVPGMSVNQLSGYEFNVSARGNNQAFANKILLLIDGRSAYVDTQGVIPWQSLPISMSEIKRIEVLKGPAGAIYGFNAFDGIVNIITKEPEEMKGATLQFGGGEYGTIRSSAVYANTHNRLGYRLSVGHDQNNQWRDRQALALRQDRLNGLINYHLTDQTTVRFEGGVVDQNRSDIVSGDYNRIAETSVFSYARVAIEDPRYFVRATWNQASQTIANTPLPAFASIASVTDRLGRSSGIPFMSNSYDLWSQWNQPLGGGHEVNVGFNYRHNTLDGTQISGFSREDRVGLYVQDHWRLFPALTLTAGARMDLHSEINPTYSPRVALVYEPLVDHTLRLSVATAYRPPTLVEAHSAVTSTFTVFGFPIPNQLQGSSNLKPEEIRSFEAEYQGWYWDHRLRLRTALFHNQIKNLISAVDVTQAVSTWVNTQGVADIQGAEMGVEFLATTWLRGFANISNQHTNQSMTGYTKRGGATTYANGGVRADLTNGLNGEAAVHFVGAGVYPVRQNFTQFADLGLIPQNAVPNPHVGSYTLLNIRTGYRFWHEKAEIAVSAFNALNDKHREYPLGDIIGSRVMGWLTLRL